MIRPIHVATRGLLPPITPAYVATRGFLRPAIEAVEVVYSGGGGVSGIFWPNNQHKLRAAIIKDDEEILNILIQSVLQGIIT